MSASPGRPQPARTEGEAAGPSLSAAPDSVPALQRLLALRDQELAAARRDADAFMHMVSHDLRAPLRHVLAYSGLLGEMLAGGEDVAPALATIERSSRQLGDMLDAVVELARLSRAPMRPVLTPCALLLDEARRSLVGQVPEADLARPVHWHIDDDLPLLPGDPPLLRQALRALLANALKFTRHTAQPRIEVGASAIEGGGVRLVVRDNGAGFDPVQSARLFQPFARLHGPRFEGLGTGLAQVRQIVRRHGGQVQAEGATGQGCTVSVTLPGLAPLG